jgi:Leucine rich repeat
MKRFKQLIFYESQIKLRFSFHSKHLFLVLLALMHTCQGDKAKDVLCEKIEDYDFGSSKGFKACFLNEKTSINSTGMKISTNDNSIRGINFYNNKEIFYLPDGVFEKLPYVMGIDAQGCSIKQISVSNFKGLNKLEILKLDHNKIEKIMSGTFKDLVVLELLDLCE